MLNPLQRENKAQSATVALFVSDIHLDASRPRTTQRFLQFLQQEARQCQQLYLLGDIFEYWAGDDDADSGEHQELIAALQALQQDQVQVFWLAGNRDFLVGADFARRCHMQLLAEPFLLHRAGKTILLAHGDAQCTDDHAYMTFRAQVRQSAWQHAFLAKPLFERKAIIAGLRQASQQAQQKIMQQGAAQEGILDVNQAAISATLTQHQCQIMLHGHTHRPALHRWQENGVTVSRWHLSPHPSRIIYLFEEVIQHEYAVNASHHRSQHHSNCGQQRRKREEN
ncbi:MAG: UDP-2,3-diacylglucosamine diphosphatase [Burkholderiales bacterium]|nr:UDP-2,3-diacylglucosamine diphosphatase [Burkholderiales bacterium]